MTASYVRKEFYICDCESAEHQFILGYFPDDEPHEKSLYLTPHLVTYDNILKRIWIAIKYVFGYRCKFGHWDEVIIAPNEAERIKLFIDGFLSCEKKP